MIVEALILSAGFLGAILIGYALFIFWLHYQKLAVRKILENSNWTEEQIEEALQNLDEIRRLIYEYEHHDTTEKTGQDIPEDEGSSGG